MTLADPVGDLEWVVLRTAPRPADERTARQVPSITVAALVAAHAELLAGDAVGESRDAGLMSAWMRGVGSHGIDILLGGHPFVPFRFGPVSNDANGLRQAVLLAPGATGVALPAGEVSAQFAHFTSWVRCLGMVDPGQRNSVAANEVGPTSTAATLEDFALHLSEPFVWLVHAAPVAIDELQRESRTLSTRLTTTRARESSETERIELERGQRRAREFARAMAVGLWRVQVLVGAQDWRGARRVSALFCGAANSVDSGHLLIPDTQAPAAFRDILGSTAEGPGRSAYPFLASTDFLSTLVRPPNRELPGIQLHAPLRFDVTPQSEADDGVELGWVLDESLSPVGRFTVRYQTLNRHTFVCGATGSGKSQTTRRLLQGLTLGPRRVPWMVIEPAKAEYAGMSGRLCDRDAVLVIRPGDVDVAPASLNPLEPEPGFPLQSHLDLLRALFIAAFQADEPFPQVVSHALTACYREAGWNLVTSAPERPVKPKFLRDEPDEPAVLAYPTLGTLQRTARRVVDSIGYGAEVAANVRGFIDVRLSSLRLGAPGRFFEGGHPLDVGELIRHNVVFELEAVTSDQDKAFLMGTILIRLVEHLRCSSPADEQLRHVLVIEEAHRLLRNAQEGPAAAAVEFFASMLAEIRAYGEGVVVVEQIPSKVISDVVKNSAFKVMHRLPALDDRATVGATMGLDEDQGKAVLSFPPGVGAVAVDGDDRPLLVRFEPSEGAESSADATKDVPLRAARSRLCGNDCNRRRCTLAELDHAARVAATPRVTIWADTVTAALVSGRTAPEPNGSVVRSWPTDTRLASCALTCLVTQATAARAVALAEWVDIADFAEHLHGVLGVLLRGEPAPRGAAERRWTAGLYRWVPAYQQLSRAIEAQPGSGASGRHPNTAKWELQGLYLDGVDAREQLRELHDHPDYRRDPSELLFGDTDTSGLKDAVKRLTGALDVSAYQRAVRSAARMDDHAQWLGMLSETYEAMGQSRAQGRR